MKAVVCTGYGSPDVLQIIEKPKPVPAADEILIRIHATTVTSGDWRIRSQEMPPGFGLIARLIFGLTKPRQPILGSEAAGEVEAVGERVTAFRPGDRVLAFDGARMGCHAEFKSMKAAGCVVPLPAGIDFKTAAALPFGGTTALHFLEKTAVREGERVLVIGAAGCVGSAIVQIASHRGAKVTGVCGSSNVDLVRSFGACPVIDYSKQDVMALGSQFDVVFETVGSLNLSQALTLVRDGGRVAMIAGGLADMVLAMFMGKPRGIKVVAGPAAERAEDLQQILDMALADTFRPLVDTVYTFGEIRDAHMRVQTRRKRGAVVVTTS
jgi:NADPH:quinone reductase-like Zn-dependent oxidoreductase